MTNNYSIPNLERDINNTFYFVIFEEFILPGSTYNIDDIKEFLNNKLKIFYI